MTEAELLTWAADFTTFTNRFAALFKRSEPREQVAKYLRGLLATVERKNSWQTAELVGDQRPDAMQRLLYRATWDVEAARDLLQQYIVEQFGEADSIGVVDETGFLKQGSASVGVKRQYSGTAGKTENCQVATFLTYASSLGHVLLDRRLFLAEEWCNDQDRRKQAGVPAEVSFATKPQQAVAMLEHAWANGVPMCWVTGDEIYGNASHLRRSVAKAGKYYVLAVNRTTPLWLVRPSVEPAGKAVTGRPRKHERLAANSPAWQVAEALLGAQAATLRWERFSVGAGEKGARLYDWTRLRVVESHEGLPGNDAWLLVRRSISPKAELAFYLSNAGPAETLLKLAQVASTRWTVEQCFAEAKGEVGLDQYEVRQYGSWYRHITLAMMAHAWLAAMRGRGGKGGASSNGGGFERGRGETAAGHRAGTTPTERRTATGLVELPAQPTPNSERQPLPAAASAACCAGSYTSAR